MFTQGTFDLVLEICICFISQIRIKWIPNWWSTINMIWVTCWGSCGTLMKRVTPEKDHAFAIVPLCFPWNSLKVQYASHYCSLWLNYLVFLLEMCQIKRIISLFGTLSPQNPRGDYKPSCITHTVLSLVLDVRIQEWWVWSEILVWYVFMTFPGITLLLSKVAHERVINKNANDQSWLTRVVLFSLNLLELVCI